MRVPRIVALAALAALVPLAMLIGVAFGGAALAPDALAHALLHPSTGGDAGTIVWQLRVPRVAIAATVGASLALAGTLLQALLRNPLVDPYLTGVSSGAGASIAIAATVGVAPALVPPMGFVSGLATAVLVAVLARRGPRLDAERLVLAGVSLSALLSAFVTLAIERLARGTASEAILAWLAGSLAGRGWSDLARRGARSDPRRAHRRGDDPGAQRAAAGRRPRRGARRRRDALAVGAADRFDAARPRRRSRSRGCSGSSA